MQPLLSANLATYAARVGLMRPTLESLVGQFDLLRVWLNDCEPPGWADEFPRVVWHRGPDRTDAGKFGFIPQGGEYYCTCDDDIIYPPDYAERIREECDAVGPVVSFHGRYFDRFPIRSIYKGHTRAHRCTWAGERLPLTIPGSGVACIDTNRVRLDIADDPPKMADVHLAIACHKAGVVPMLGRHPKGWIKLETLPGGIYKEKVRDDGDAVALINATFVGKCSMQNKR